MSRAYEELEIIAELLQEWAVEHGYEHVNGYVLDGHASFFTRAQADKEELEVHVGYEDLEKEAV